MGRVQTMGKSTTGDKYVALGGFYTLKYENGRSFPCRNILEIIIKNAKNSSQYSSEELLSIPLDAVFIMMNPGGGKPKNQVKSNPIVNADTIDDLNKIELVETVPDITQNQVMKIMDAKKWNRVKVINLSDYREPKSFDFYNMIKEAKFIDETHVHSIFSEKRRQELTNVFRSERDITVVVAWGVNTKLKPLIELSLDNNFIINRVGYPKEVNVRRNNLYYYHPLPWGNCAKKRWVRETIKNLDNFYRRPNNYRRIHK